MPSAGRWANHQALATSDVALGFIRNSLANIERTEKLLEPLDAGPLTWQLILIVAESQHQSKSVYVSDLYVSASAAKTTINSRIINLIKEGIFKKSTPPNDARRQEIKLTPVFMQSLQEFISESLDMMKEV
jgi:DNA-binding MarR family transcriptional regulator